MKNKKFNKFVFVYIGMAVAVIAIYMVCVFIVKEVQRKKTVNPEQSTQETQLTEPFDFDLPDIQDDTYYPEETEPSTFGETPKEWKDYLDRYRNDPNINTDKKAVSSFQVK